MKPPLLCGSPKSVQTSGSVSQRPLSQPKQAQKETNRISMAAIRRKLGSPLAKKKTGRQSGKVFGVSLDVLMRDASPGSDVPRLVEKVCHFIRERGLGCEGIFRVSGNQKVLTKLRLSFDKTGDADVSQIDDVPAVASLLKQFLRELPVPVIPDHLKEPFMRAYANNKSNSEACAKQLKSIVQQLPASHVQLLKYICRFLLDVCEREDVNKMGHIALAIVFGPNLFRLSDGLIALQEQAFTNGVTAVMLQRYEDVFGEAVHKTTMMTMKKKPEKPLPFAEHVEQKKKKKIGRNRALTVCEDEAEMTVAGYHGLSESLLADNAGDPANQTLYDGSLELAKKRRKTQRRSVSASFSNRPLPPDPIALSKAASAENLVDDDNDGVDGVIYATIPARSDPNLREKRHLDVPRLVLSGLAAPDGNYSDVPPGFFPAHVNIYGDQQQTDGRRSVSPWSVSSGAPSPQPTTPRKALQLRTLVHETVGKFLFAAPEEMLLPLSGGAKVKNGGVKGKISAWQKKIDGVEEVGEEEKEESQAKVIKKRRKKVEKPVSLSLTESEVKEAVPQKPASDFLSKMRLIERQLNFTPVVKFDSSSPDPDEDIDQKSDFDALERNAASGLLTSLTLNRAPLPRNRRKPSRNAPSASADVPALDLDLLSREEERKEPVALRSRAGPKLEIVDFDVSEDVKVKSEERARRRRSKAKDEKKLSEDKLNVPSLSEEEMAGRLPKLSTVSVDSAFSSLPSSPLLLPLEQTMKSVSEDLTRKRLASGRADDMDDMFLRELRDEKQCLQRTLLLLEKRHGRPSSAAEKDLSRPLYNRYREVKTRIQEMEKLGVGEEGKTGREVVADRLRLDSGVQLSPTSKETTPDSLDGSVTSNDDVLKTASMEELSTQLKTAQKTKRKLRDSLKEFERKFEERAGKKVKKVDRGPMEGQYADYKKVKSSIRLINKLLSERHGTSTL